MTWSDIKVSDDGTHFVLNDEKLYGRSFIEALKFHAPGLAPVKDESGCYHIDINGSALYGRRYLRTFGFYCNRAAVIDKEGWVHIDDKGARVYDEKFAWAGNFQEDKCTVRSIIGCYFHIDAMGRRVYEEVYSYAGDFKDGVACVRLHSGFFIHIDGCGAPINDKHFLDLGVFHKNYATAKDERGWHHIDKAGDALYRERYQLVEPFYNGFALATNFEGSKVVIGEAGEIVHEIRSYE